MNGLIDTLKGLGRTRLLVLAGVGISIVVAVIFMMGVLARPAMSPLYTGLDPAEAAQVARVIEQMGVPYRMEGDGTAVYVPRAEFGNVRMTLAENGLPSRGGVGYELFDDSGALGMTSFMQQVNRLRALEGELARTIQTVSGIRSARVHLVLPEREAFSREAPEPSASVVIRTAAGFSLERAQALAIRHLVSSSVPNLRPSAVTVLDTSGRLLLADEGSGSSEGSTGGLRANIESRIATDLEKLLSARVGAGNVRVRVSAELTGTRQVTRSESYDPSGQVPRSTQLVEEEEASLSDEESVSVQQNLPMAGMQGGPSSSMSRNRTEQTTNFEISSTVTESVVEPGQVDRLSVAVLVNGEYVKENGETVYRDRDAAELARIRELVEAAIGFDAERGDKVAVDSMQFIDYAFDLGEPVGIDFKAILAENMVDIVRWIVGLAALALLVFGLRPVLARVIPQRPETSEATSVQVAASEGASTSGEEVEAATAAAVPDEAEDEATIYIEQVRGNIKASKIKRLAKIIEENQEEAVKVMKAWIARG